MPSLLCGNDLTICCHKISRSRLLLLLELHNERLHLILQVPTVFRPILIIIMTFVSHLLSDGLITEEVVKCAVLQLKLLSDHANTDRWAFTSYLSVKEGAHV